MAAREAFFAALLLVAGGLIVQGCAQIDTGVAWIVAGLLLAGWSWLIFGEVQR